MLAAIPQYTFDDVRLSALAGFGILDTPPEEGFDSIVELATQLCACPVALVSLVDRDRQWFKARVNFPSCETDLDSSVCAHALRSPGVLVIPDLTTDPRTAANPLVTGEPFIRFYAGAPLRTRDGQTLGSLCVIDKRPRPKGLTPTQLKGLTALASQVMSQLELRRAMAGQQRLVERGESLIRTQHAIGLARGDRVAILKALIAGAMEAVPHAEGGAIEMREGDELVYVATAGRVLHDMGLRVPLRDSLAGVCLLANKPMLCPDVVRDGQIKPELVARLDVRSCLLMPLYVAGEPIGVLKLQASRPDAFTPEDLRLAQVFAGTVTSGLAEASFREQAVSTKELLELGDRLRDASTADEAILIGGEIAGRSFKALRAGYCAADPATDMVTLAAHWGANSIAGTYALRDFGNFVDQLKRGEPVVIGNVTTDPRTASHAANFTALGIGSVINLPVLEHGRMTSIFFVHKAEARDWTREEISQCINIADRTRSAVAKLDAEAQQRVLNEELSHRMKNTMALVQAIALQTLRGVTEKQVVAAFTDRIHALAQAHNVLMQEKWASANIHGVVAAVLGNFGQIERFDTSGPDLKLGPRATLSLSLLLHELATNAMKHGSLSVPGGHVLVSWKIKAGETGEELVFTWRETGGPAAREPARKGFGSRLLQMGLTGSDTVTMNYGETGLKVEMRASLANAQAT